MECSADGVDGRQGQLRAQCKAPDSEDCLKSSTIRG